MTDCQCHPHRIIEEYELTDHFLMAVLFILPSVKEGFGIVLLKPWCGLPVIYGNADGSTAAVRHEGMGTAIDPYNVAALKQARLKLQQDLEAADKKKHPVGMPETFQQSVIRYNLNTIDKE